MIASLFFERMFFPYKVDRWFHAIKTHLILATAAKKIIQMCSTVKEILVE